MSNSVYWYKVLMLWLKRAISSHANVISLFFVQLGQFHTDAVQVQTGYFFIEVFGQNIHVEGPQKLQILRPITSQSWEA